VAVFWEVIGWVSAVILVGAYAAVATRRLDARSAVYHILNVVAAAGLVAYSIYKLAWPQFALNVFWGAVGVIGIILAVRGVRASASSSRSGATNSEVDETRVREG